MERERQKRNWSRIPKIQNSILSHMAQYGVSQVCIDKITMGLMKEEDESLLLLRRLPAAGCNSSCFSASYETGNRKLRIGLFSSCFKSDHRSLQQPSIPKKGQQQLPRVSDKVLPLCYLEMPGTVTFGMQNACFPIVIQPLPNMSHLKIFSFLNLTFKLN